MRDLTKLGTDQLVQLMTAENIQVPAAIAATTTPATIAQYADSMVSSLKEAFPTDYVAKSFGVSTDATNQAVATFLGTSPDFDFAATNIDAYLTAHPAAVVGQSTDQVAALTDRLKAAQRVFRVVTDGDVMQTLIKNGLDSSHEIASTPNGSFIAQYADALGGEDQAQQIYATAANISGVVSLILRQAQDNAAPETPQMIRRPKDATGKKPPLPTGFPDWQTLFGSTSTCQCTECRAVDGPAAYFVSLLEFLKRLPKNKDGHTPRDVLMSRRPDLGYLKLSCANADTAMPYVDVVNEIMENYVTNSKVVDQVVTSKVTKLAAHDTPTDATTEALDVNPEYTQTPDAVTAYQKLNDSTVVYPYALPFDRDLETVRKYLNFLGVSLYQLGQDFGLPLTKTGPSGPALSTSTRLAAEYLNISEPELVLIANQDFAGNPPTPQSGLWDYFGYQDSDQSDWRGKIAKVSEFLDRTGVTFDQLVDLLQTQYLNPQHLTAPEQAASLNPKNENDLCDITNMTIDHDAEFIAALPPFLRLWRKLGWSISELDYTLRVFDETPETVTGHELKHVPAQFVLIAAQIQQLRRMLTLSVRQTVSLWKDIDTDGRKSPFITLFQNKAVISPPDAGFRLLYQVPYPLPPGLLLNGLPFTWSDGTPQNQAFIGEGQFQFIGAMTDSQRDDLLSLWAKKDESAILAVQTLHSQRWFSGIALAGSPPPLGFGNKGPGQGLPQAPAGALPTRSYAVDLISNHINAILAALLISASDLLAIVQDAGYYNNSADWGPLTVGHLSGIYRYAILAQSLGLSVPDLIALKTLTGIQPVRTTSGKDGARTEPMMQFVTAAQQVTASPFTVAQLAYLYGLDTASPASLSPLQATQDAVMATILVGLQNIAAANAAAPDPTGAILRKKLAVQLSSAAQLEAAMGLISGAAVYSTPLTALAAGLTLPAGPVSFVATATAGGIVNANDVLSLTMTAGPGSPVTVSYTVQSDDTLVAVAAGLAAQINGNSTLAQAGIIATASGFTISLPAPAAMTPPPAWSASSTPANPTETVTLSTALVCAGPDEQTRPGPRCALCRMAIKSSSTR